MERFGFAISKGRQIDFESNDRSLAEMLAVKEPSFLRCIECGCCSATCTAAGFTEFSLRELHILIRRGEVSSVRKSISKCMLCGKCTLVCPRGVNTRNVVTLVRKTFQTEITNAV